METTAANPVGKLNTLQVSLLRLFDRGMTDEQLLDLKRVLVNHYSALLANEVDQASQQKGYSADDFTAMLNNPS
ncbi:hypothetical protein [Fibrella aquatica]|jgi:hypothetical protein|uniref:hypothetical protein n=1 Tax=Fibrella aquatica TaxID=3242487 RepID=UPI00351FB778